MKSTPRALLALGLVSLVPALSGCDDYSWRSLIINMVRAGIQVSVSAGEDDTCAKAQARQWIDEFRALSDAEKQHMSAELRRRVDRIEFRSTDTTMVVRGERITLTASVRNCVPYGRSFYCSRQWLDKNLADGRTYEGVEPRTLVQVTQANPRHVIVTAQQTRDESVLREYRAWDLPTYERINDTGWDFIVARSEGYIYHRYENARIGYTCGPRRSLHNLGSEEPEVIAPAPPAHAIVEPAPVVNPAPVVEAPAAVEAPTVVEPAPAVESAPSAMTTIPVTDADEERR